ncbi:50S ribosomal protein L13 [Hippea sp. KM1]|uniref:50S ribosomal protein L13 n=1 Tax=Hippea sp. KM1 TaxID=944481 RepID=UPI00046D7003|nr:50S ribosomal protein L13 [Hippea sp. KM1]
MQKTFMAKFEPDKRKWYLIDAKGKTLGRIATQIANILRGKNKPTFTPHVDTGDFVVVINAKYVKLTGKKLDQKYYYRHSGYIGGLKAIKARDMLQKFPERVIVHAVKGMLPKNRLSNRLITKLKVYAEGEHPHKAQNPVKIEV